jgi:hypothetical protein
MSGKKVAILKNDFPYDALIPPASKIEHFCLWATKEKFLASNLINDILDKEFADKPVLVYRHNKRLSTIRNLPHIHIFVDSGFNRQMK